MGGRSRLLHVANKCKAYTHLFPGNKKYRFAWHEDQEDAKSDVTVSSVHTSDLSVSEDFTSESELEYSDLTDHENEAEDVALSPVKAEEKKHEGGLKEEGEVEEDAVKKGEIQTDEDNQENNGRNLLKENRDRGASISTHCVAICMCLKEYTVYKFECFCPSFFAQPRLRFCLRYMHSNTIMHID